MEIPLELATWQDINDELKSRPNERFITLYRTKDKQWLWAASPMLDIREALPKAEWLVESWKRFLKDSEGDSNT